MPVTQSNTYTLTDDHANVATAEQGDDNGTPKVALVIGGQTVYATADEAHTFAAGINFIADNLPTP